MNEYKIEYLKIFYDDLKEIADYISLELKNKDAAHRLINELQKKIELLKITPFIYQYYDFQRPMKGNYRYFVLGHYLVFYKVDVRERIVTIYRIIYSKRNITHIIE